MSKSTILSSINIKSKISALEDILKLNRSTQKIHSTPMFIAALFTIAKIWKQPKCPSTDEWIKTWYIDNGIPLSHKKE